MRLLAFFALAAVVIGAAVLWLMRPPQDGAAVNAVVSNATADQQAIDAANRDIENEERAAAARLAESNKASAPAGNAAR